MATLKDKMQISAENNLKEYEKLLHALKCSNVPNKEQRIKDCEHAIKKAKTNIKQFKSLLRSP